MRCRSSGNSCVFDNDDDFVVRQVTRQRAEIAIGSLCRDFAALSAAPTPVAAYGRCGATGETFQRRAISRALIPPLAGNRVQHLLIP